ncbi:MAG: reverse transcriptase N-terminal domain-containing protein [bacterium]
MKNRKLAERFLRLEPKGKWEAINWQKVNTEVRRLQMRIAKAEREGKYLLFHGLSNQLRYLVILPGFSNRTIQMLEPCAGKLARTILRGKVRREPRALPDSPASHWVLAMQCPPL